MFTRPLKWLNQRLSFSIKYAYHTSMNLEKIMIFAMQLRILKKTLMLFKEVHGGMKSIHAA